MMLFRKILFYCFLLIYFTVCPWLIFYTLGYRFDLKGDQGIVRTGAFSVTTQPEGAEVSLGNKRASQKTPAVILNLREGQYDVRVQKEGYQPWFNRIHIEAERAVVAEKIILLPAELKPELVSRGPFEKIELFKEGTLALVLRSLNFSDLTVIDLIKNTEYGPGETPRNLFQKSKIEAVYTVPASSVFWLWLDDSNGRRMVRGRIRFGVLEIEDWSRYFPAKPDELQWDVNAENKVYALRDGALTVIDLDRGAAHAAGQDLQGFKVSRQRVFLSRSRGGIVRADSDGRHPRALLDDPVLADELFGGRKKLDIGVYPGGTLLFWDPSGALFSNRLPYWIARKNVRGYTYDTLSSQAAVWTETKIGVLDFSRDSFLREEAFERKLRKRWIYRGGEEITRILWAADGTQLIFQDKKNVYLLEAAQGLEARPRLLTEADSSFPLFFSEAQGLLYYADPKTQDWLALRLIPKRELLGEAFTKTGLLDEKTGPEQRAAIA